MATAREVLTDRLARANRVRHARAEWKREVTVEGVMDALTDPPEWLETASVEEVLRTIPKIGPVKVREILRSAGIGDAAKLGGLTERQRTELVGVLRDRQAKAEARARTGR